MASLAETNPGRRGLFVSESIWFRLGASLPGVEVVILVPITWLAGKSFQKSLGNQQFLMVDFPLSGQFPGNNGGEGG